MVFNSWPKKQHHHEKVSFIDRISRGAGNRPDGLQCDADGNDEERVLAERRYQLRDTDKDDRKLRCDEEDGVLMQNAKWDNAKWDNAKCKMNVERKELRLGASLSFSVIWTKIAFCRVIVVSFAMWILRKTTHFGKSVAKTWKNLQMLHRFAIFACDFEKPNRRGLNLTLGYYSDIDI